MFNILKILNKNPIKGLNNDQSIKNQGSSSMLQVATSARPQISGIIIIEIPRITFFLKDPFD